MQGRFFISSGGYDPVPNLAASAGILLGAAGVTDHLYGWASTTWATVSARRGPPTT
jgi:hypothetical protein